MGTFWRASSINSNNNSLNSNNRKISVQASDIIEVGKLKVQYSNLSMVDAQLMLAKKFNSAVITTDSYLIKAYGKTLILEY